jgi:antibiotic biosynthesis monooxygenase (ABM) superfamily enzyme
MPSDQQNSPDTTHDRPATRFGPPNKHQLALMIWIAVFPTLTVLNLTIGPLLANQHPVVRTFFLVSIAIPIVSYGLMPQLHRLRLRLLARSAGWVTRPAVLSGRRSGAEA